MTDTLQSREQMLRDLKRATAEVQLRTILMAMGASGSVVERTEGGIRALVGGGL